MPAAQPLPESAVPAVPAASSFAAPTAFPAPGRPLPPARLADELAVPAPSPVHQLQAGLIQLTAPPEPVAEQLYPGWFRLGFPILSSALLWAVILWGTGQLG